MRAALLRLTIRTHLSVTPVRVTTGRLSHLRDTAGVGLGQRERNRQTPIKLAPATDEWARIPTPHVSYSGQ